MNTANVLYATGIAFTAIVTYLGVRLTTRVSQKATDTTATLTERANAMEGMDKLVHALEARLEKVENRADRLGERVQALEDERRRDKSLIRLLIEYVNILRDAFRRLGETVPDAPAGLDIEGGPLS